MFNLNDSTYRSMPKTMPISVAKKILDEVADYCITKKLTHFDITLHGGEPFLWGAENFFDFFDYFNESVKNILSLHGVNISFSLTTNGYFFNVDILDILRRNKVIMGISLDGPESFHDTYRVNHANKGSYQKIIENVNKIINLGYGKVIGGFLTVINPLIKPIEYFDWILSLPITKVDVLYPMSFNYQNFPWDFYNTSQKNYKESPVIGKWLSELFNIWFEYDNPRIEIESFIEAISIFLGSKSHGDQIINDTLGLFVIDTDGSVEYHDYFRGFKNNEIKTSYNIAINKIEDLEKDIVFSNLFLMKNFLPKPCEKCEVRNICGGGFLAGRLKESINDFTLNRSVLCYDHYFFYSSFLKTILAAYKITPEFSNRDLVASSIPMLT